jgi:hypothetical protein
MTQADRVYITPPTNTPIDTTRRRFLTVAAGASVASVGTLAVAAMPTALPAGADAELIALSKQLEPLVDAYYVARATWAHAMVQRHDELEKQFGDPADRGYQDPPEYRAAAEEIDDRVGVDVAADQLHTVFEKVEPIAKAIEAFPCTSIDGLRAKALVAFWEVAPLCAGDTEFHFEDAYPFQRLFCAVAEFCGLNAKLAATGFELPNIDCIDEVGDDEGEEA